MSAFGLAASVALGAFGAHGLRGAFVEGGEELYRRGVYYLAVAFIGTGLLACWAGSLVPPRSAVRSAALLTAGGLVFAFTLAGLSLGGPGWLGAVTPFGGAAMIAGFLLVGASARAGWRAREDGPPA